VIWERDVLTAYGGTLSAETHARYVAPDGTLAGTDGGTLLSSTGGYVRTPRVASDGQGYLAVWSAANGSSPLYGVRLDKTGAAVGTNPLTLVSGNLYIYYTLTGGPVGYAAFWMDGNGLYINGQRLNPDGTPNGSIVTLDTVGVQKAYLSAATSADGFLVAWGVQNYPTYSLMARKLQADGTLPYAAITVTTGSVVTLNTATATEGDHFVIGWLAYPNGSPPTVQLARFNSDGTALDAAPIPVPGLLGEHGLSLAAGGGMTLVAGDEYSLAIHGSPIMGRLLGPSVAQGSACLADWQCTTTGHCAGGVCCDTACTGGDCQACTQAAGAATDGTCGPIVAAHHVCRAAPGVCDTVEECDGTNVACPPDQLAPATVVCRAAAGPCDAAERCTGTSGACPPDQLAATTVVCRPATGPCDAAESCTGTSAACPPDGLAVDGTTCSGADRCFGTYACTGGACVGSQPVVCGALDACHAPGTCDPATGQCSQPSQPDGTACDDGDACTRSSTCEGGQCTGSDPVVCPLPDQCHVVASCRPADGTCPTSSKPDGATCDDGDKCTTGDSCAGGACRGSPVKCVAADECHAAGQCAPDTGACSSPPLADGTPCSTGACKAGVCTPVAPDAGDGVAPAGGCHVGRRGDGSGALAVLGLLLALQLRPRRRRVAKEGC
jgi:hypothetical protein